MRKLLLMADKGLPLVYAPGPIEIGFALVLVALGACIQVALLG